MIKIQPGDILMYNKNPNLFNLLVDVAEEAESRKKFKTPYFHCAIALGQWDKIEADGRRVDVNPIHGDDFRVFRPPIPSEHISYALCEIRKYIGQIYDWILIIDDALRYLTRNHVHLPVRFVRSIERHAKVCTTLLARYFFYAGWGPFYGLNVSPQDIYYAIKDFEVKEA